MSMNFVIRFASLAFLAGSLSGCIFGGGGDSDVAPSTKQVSAEAQILLTMKGLRADAPVFIRIFKEESQLEVWKARDDGRFELFKTYPICAWSGTLGPKLQQGDKQAPEGFYTVRPNQLNPMSMYHLAFNIGFPNDYDKVNGHTGSALMVHGNCKSAGCYAMTDTYIEEIYALVREAFRGGQQEFSVNAFPFRMTEENMRKHRDSQWYSFWTTLKPGYDSFEFYRVPPKVAVCSRQYLVNVSFMGIDANPDPASQCPPFQVVAPDSRLVPGQGRTLMASGTHAPQAAHAGGSGAPAAAAFAAPEPVVAQASYTQPPAPAYAQAPSVRTASAGAAPRPSINTAAMRRAEPEPAPEPAQAAAPPVAVAAAPAVPPSVHQSRSDTPPQPEETAVVAAAGEQSIRRGGKGDMLAPSTALGYAPR